MLVVSDRSWPLYHVMSRGNGRPDFVSDIKARFLSDTKKEDLPQYNSMFRDCDPDDLLKNASAILGFDLVAARMVKRSVPWKKIIEICWYTSFGNLDVCLTVKSGILLA